jgi:hypothetical protein
LFFDCLFLRYSGFEFSSGSAPIAMRFAPEQDCGIAQRSLIWIPDTDANGTLADAEFTQVAYLSQFDFFQYRADELTDPAIRAELLEKAVFRASKAKKRAHVEDRRRYLFRTYASLVDATIAGHPKTSPAEPLAFDYLSSAGTNQRAEEELTNRIYQREVLDAMPDDARHLWEMRLFGYSFEEMADELDETADTLNARARRGAKEAFKRLFSERYR